MTGSGLGECRKRGSIGSLLAVWGYRKRLVSAGACAFDPKFSLARKRCITFALSARTRSGLVSSHKGYRLRDLVYIMQ